MSPLPAYSVLRGRLRQAVHEKGAQGYAIDGMLDELAAVPDAYDALTAFAGRLAAAPLRDDWPWVEPVDLDAIRVECDPGRQIGPAPGFDPLRAEHAARIEAAFLGRVCGCMLGKPFEIMRSLPELRAALETVGEWPLTDYPTEAAVRALPEMQGQWFETVRERIDHVAPDDDLNYTLLGMLVLEAHGAAFTHQHLQWLWLLNLPLAATFGPERTYLLQAGLDSLGLDVGASFPLDTPTGLVALNPGEELCGALIRADAYGYAAIGNPELAAALAFRDASLTHQRTGVYSTMFVAAALAAAPLAEEPLAMFDIALQHVPQRSRFAAAVRDSLADVRAAADWLDGWARVNARFGDYGHCRVLQEIGTVANTLRFATDIGHGIGLQVMQGNDTDSFGATAGSLLGLWFGPGHLDDRWVAPFNDDLRAALAVFSERSLARVAARMGELPARLAGVGPELELSLDHGGAP